MVAFRQLKILGLFLALSLSACGMDPDEPYDITELDGDEDQITDCGETPFLTADCSSDEEETGEDGEDTGDEHDS